MLEEISDTNSTHVLSNPAILITALVSLYVLFRLVRDYIIPRLKGRLGEYRVARRLGRLNKRDYRVHNNLYLKLGNKTTQIDHLVLSVYGIFVIETKNHKGWIFGNDRSQYWTQTLYSRKYKIYNPVLQNWAHINLLKELSADFRRSVLIPIVVFSGSATLKKINSSVPVIKKRKLLKTIRKQKEIQISHADLQVLDEAIKKLKVFGYGVRKLHRQNVRTSKSKRSFNSKTCPKCGGRLEVKHGRYGWFLGCSNFPRCSFSKNVK